MHNGEELSTLSPKERYWIRNFKMDIAAECKRYGDLPPLEGCLADPKVLIPICEVDKNHWPGAFAHSFKDDYKFDGLNGVWCNTERYVALLLRWKMGALGMDYSTYGDAHPEFCRWNRFRSRIIGYHFEKRGVPLIPTLLWWDDESADEACIGLRRGRVYAVSTIRAAHSRDQRELFGTRIRRICSVLDPKILVVYGSPDGIDWGDINIHAFPNGTYNWTHMEMRAGA